MEGHMSGRQRSGRPRQALAVEPGAASRNCSGKFEDIQTYERPVAAGARLGIVGHEEEVPMTRKIALRLVVAALLGLASPLLACPSKEKSEVEKLKDAGEDVSDAVEDAGAAVKEEAE